jgi:hypothetical protein
MQSDSPLLTVLRKYVEVDEVIAQQISAELEQEPINETALASKERILEKIELHSVAHGVIEEEVSKYREDLYTLCKAIASRELERNIITESHVLRARQEIRRSYKKVSFTDLFLTIGSLLVGAAIPHIFDIVGGATPNEWLLGLSIIGGIFLGMGLYAKVQGN